MSTQSYHLLVAPPQDALLPLIRALAAQLLDAPPDGWSQPAQETEPNGDVRHISRNGVACIRVAAPTASADGWVELDGFPDGGRARWVYDAPPRLVLIKLADAAVDAVWGAMRAQQAEALRQHVRARGAHPVHTGRPIGGFPSLQRATPPDHVARLPRIAQPPFAPDDFPKWLFNGELSSLPREVEAIGEPVAGVALDEDPDRRLLVRPFHRRNAETIVPMIMMPRGHRPHGGTASQRGFLNPTEVARALVAPLGRLAGGVEIAVPKFSADRETPASEIFLSRFVHLAQLELQPFRTAGAVARVPRSDIALRMLEVRTAFGLPGRPDGLLEVSVDGLPGGTQVHVVGHRDASLAMTDAANAWKVRSFVVGPREQIEDVRLVVERALA